MHVIGAGFGRTGTLSLKAALEQLGFAPCLHMVDLISTGERVESWAAAAAGEAVDWRAVLEGYEATVDWPACSFYEQLMAEFPDAKVVLTVRDPDAWYDSTERTMYAAQAAIRENELSGGTQAPPSAELMRVISTLIWDGTFGGRFTERDHAIAVFQRHNEAVKATVPADRLLVYEVAEGWEPLARFLGVETPETPFPRLNDTAAFREMVGMAAL